MGERIDATGEELVLVHLLDAPKGTEAERNPSLTQTGIAGGTGLDRSYVSVLLGKITEGALAVRSLDRVKGSRRKVGVFSLTSHGFERALSIKQRLMSSNLIVKVDGQARDVELREALKLFAGESAASLVSKSQRGVLDASSSEPISDEIARAQKLLDEDRQADCAALLRGFANRWIRAGYHDELLLISSAITKSRVPAGDASALLLADADVHEVRGDWERARLCLEMVDSDEAPIRAEALFRLGVLAYRRDDADSARELYRRGLALVGKEEPLHGRILNAVGVLAWASGQAGEAAARYAEAEKLALDTRDAEGLMRVRSNLGILAADAGDAAKAIDYYGKAITVAEAISDLKTVSSLYSNVGDVYASKGDKGEALRFYDRSMALAEKLAFTWQIAELHRSLAGVAEGAEREKHLRRALELFEKLGAESDAFKVREMMGEKL
ncbi:MAG: tetratricopeptide repeat protein [Methanobacteriota archaeon]